MICFSRAPIDRLIAYKERMGWEFPYVSTNGTEFPFDFGLRHARAGAGDPRGQGNSKIPPSGSKTGGGRSEKLEDGMREIRASSPSRATTEPCTTPTPSRRVPFVAPYSSFLIKRTPKPEPEEPRAWRKDEYPD